jgi:hypothetical protein
MRIEYNQIRLYIVLNNQTVILEYFYIPTGTLSGTIIIREKDEEIIISTSGNSHVYSIYSRTGFGRYRNL